MINWVMIFFVNLEFETETIFHSRSVDAFKKKKKIQNFVVIFCRFTLKY